MRLSRILSVFVSLYVATVSPFSIVSAAGFTEPPAITNRQKAHQNVIFTGGGENAEAEACKDSSGSINLTGKNNLEKIFNYFKAKGLTSEQAAGIVGNISVESGGDPENIQDPGGRTKDPSTISSGWGIIQWTPGSKIIGLLNAANITTPVYELSTQLEMVWWHMNHTSPTGVQNMYKDFKNIATVEQATIEFEDKVEGAGTPHIETRIERAKQALREFGGGSGSTSPTSGSSDTGCGGEDGGVASANGFTFPLITTQSAITGNKPYPWCYKAATNCHHDYKAADIMIPTGTTVIAAKPGRVQNTNAGNQHPNNVTITTDDGLGINYYTHMGANTVKVRIGQKVKAGDVLGKIGTSEDAMGTPPHLHFDMLPARYKYRPGCSGAGCSSFPFIEVQPALTETFKLLPKG
jgi:murein DD-endopeptidase MepM/ murein hydrolase activator NlpD